MITVQVKFHQSGLSFTRFMGLCVQSSFPDVFQTHKVSKHNVTIETWVDCDSGRH